MISRIANQTGRIYHAEQHSELAKIRPCYAFIPQNYFGVNGFQRRRYVTSRWPSINAGANPLAIGSHVLPDSKRPVSSRSKCPILKEFLCSLKTIAAVKTNRPTDEPDP